MLLYQVFQGCGLDEELKRHKNFEILNVSHAHEHCDDKTIYFCFAQNYQTALAKCQFAVENGAKIVVSNFDLPLKECVVTEDCRGVFANCCANFYHHACDKLKIVGITGTNGKTTTSHIIGEMLKRNGKKVGVIGTSGIFYDGKTLPSPLTTPDADFLHKTFFDMQACGIEYVVMEVSAHAIDQKRIDGIKFELGVLTTERGADGKIHITMEVAEECIQKRAVKYDKTGDNHYDTISAFIKSMRGSDPDAAVYYLARMLYAGEDVKFIARRIMIHASEDVGNADPQALLVAEACFKAVEVIGMPECRINLAQAAVYMALAPKSCSAYAGIGKALDEVRARLPARPPSSGVRRIRRVSVPP